MSMLFTETVPTEFPMGSSVSTIGSQTTGVMPISTMPYWIGGALGEIDELKSLAADWDTYGSPPITDLALRRSREILSELGEVEIPVASVVPVPGGGIQMEWDVPGRSLEIEILPNGEIEYLEAIEGMGDREGSIHPSGVRELVRTLNRARY